MKKPERVAALGYILFMAAVIYTLWERRVRMALDNEDIELIEGLTCESAVLVTRRTIAPKKRML